MSDDQAQRRGRVVTQESHVDDILQKDKDETITGTAYHKKTLSPIHLKYSQQSSRLYESVNIVRGRTITRIKLQRLQICTPLGHQLGYCFNLVNGKHEAEKGQDDFAENT